MTRQQEQGDVEDGRTDASEGARFEAASNTTRGYLCLGKITESKKHCVVILGLLLLIIVNMIPVIAPPDFLASESGQKLLAASERWARLAGQYLPLASNKTTAG